MLDCQIRSFKLAVKDIKSNWWLALDLQNSLQTLEDKVLAKIEKIDAVQKEIDALTEAARESCDLDAVDLEDQSIEASLKSRVQKALDLTERVTCLKEQMQQGDSFKIQSLPNSMSQLSEWDLFASDYEEIEYKNRKKFLTPQT